MKTAMEQDKKLTEILSDKRWHTWKCRCGCLNGKWNGNCGRCGGMIGLDSMYYGDEVIHGGIWQETPSTTLQNHLQ